MGLEDSQLLKMAKMTDPKASKAFMDEMVKKFQTYIDMQDFLKRLFWDKKYYDSNQVSQYIDFPQFEVPYNKTASKFDSWLAQQTSQLESQENRFCLRYNETIPKYGKIVDDGGKKCASISSCALFYIAGESWYVVSTTHWAEMYEVRFGCQSDLEHFANLWEYDTSLEGRRAKATRNGKLIGKLEAKSEHDLIYKMKQYQKDWFHNNLTSSFTPLMSAIHYHEVACRKLILDHRAFTQTAKIFLERQVLGGDQRNMQGYFQESKYKDWASQYVKQAKKWLDHPAPCGETFAQYYMRILGLPFNPA